MPTQRDRREAAEILRRIVATLPEPTPVQVAFLLGQSSALDSTVQQTDSARRARGDAAQASPVEKS